MKRIHLIGLGALGGIYAAQVLKKNPKALTVIAHGERAENLKRSGIIVNKEKFDLEIESTPSEFADLILVAVKYHQLPSAMNDMKPFVGPDTAILSLLNGISSEEILAEEFGMDKVIHGFGIEMDALKNGNEIHYKSLGRIVFGEKNATEKSARIKLIEDFFIEHNVPYEIPENIEKAMWFKFMLNAGVNQVSSILGANFQQFHSDGEPRRLMISISQEVVNLSQKLGINLGTNDIERMVEIINRLNPEGKTSMLQDIEAGRPTEVDYFAGKIIELGKKYDVPTPFNEMIFEKLKSKQKN